jgi:N-acetylmuramoyl-L-alanine amidase
MKRRRTDSKSGQTPPDQRITRRSFLGRAGIGTYAALSVPPDAFGVVRQPLGDGAYALLRRSGPKLILEIHLPGGDQSRRILERYLADPAAWKIYAAVQVAAIPYEKLKPDIQRDVMLAIFREDMVDAAGWHHTVKYPGEGLWTICEWLTGRGSTYEDVQAYNSLKDITLRHGQRVTIPNDLLKEAMRAPIEVVNGGPIVDLDEVQRQLRYTTKDGVPCAVYRIQLGEALYSAVVVRFTDRRDNEDILAAADDIAKLSGIADLRDIDEHTPIYIPVEMLSSRFKPLGHPDRQRYEETLLEAKRLKSQVTAKKDLAGIVVVLDAGHGGKDHGASAARYALYEDELSYDITCRVKRILETTTAAKVYVTMHDPSQGYMPVSAKRFRHDTDEIVLTSPNYPNEDGDRSVILRWYLANAVYHKEIKAGTDPMKMVFTSFHCDHLFNERVRGAMVYIPGAHLRRDKESWSNGSAYTKYAEVRAYPNFHSTKSERKRDEAVSLNFARTLVDELGKKRIKRHDKGDPIRNQIWRGKKPILPGVLRANKIPTKVLVEAANMNNATDCRRLADPDWRQWFAEAYVNALKAHYTA